MCLHPRTWIVELPLADKRAEFCRGLRCWLGLRVLEPHTFAFLVRIEEFYAGSDQGFLNGLHRTDPRIYDAAFKPCDAFYRHNCLIPTFLLAPPQHTSGSPDF